MKHTYHYELQFTSKNFLVSKNDNKIQQQNQTENINFDFLFFIFQSILHDLTVHRSHYNMLGKNNHSELEKVKAVKYNYLQCIHIHTQLPQQRHNETADVAERKIAERSGNIFIFR